jgi:cytochrome c biogenesis protein CcmG, thiol:disulfide interchange protein DsbE
VTDLLQVGPLMLAADRTIAALAIVAFLGTTRWWRGVAPERARNVAALAVLVGAVAARAFHVASHAASYAEEPWSALAVWQGGFEPAAGVLAAALVLLLAFRGVRRAAVPLSVLAAVATLGLAGVALLDRRAVDAWPPGLVATTLDGESVALDAFRGRPFVVNLWATWCPPCRREMPRLTQAAQQRADVSILLVNQGEDAAVVLAYLESEALPSEHVLLDPGHAFAAAVDSAALPTTLFVDATGTVRRRHHGEISRAALTDGLREIAPGGPP